MFEVEFFVVQCLDDLSRESESLALLRAMAERCTHAFQEHHPTTAKVNFYIVRKLVKCEHFQEAGRLLQRFVLPFQSRFVFEAWREMYDDFQIVTHEIVARLFRMGHVDDALSILEVCIPTPKWERLQLYHEVT